MKAITTALLLLGALLVAGCEGGLPWGSDRGADADSDRDRLGPVAAYERHILFLGAGPDLPAAATLTFTTVSDSTRVWREESVRLALAGRWDSVTDSTWSMAPVREPWRILPGGGLRVVVTDAGELGALVHEAEDTVRIEPNGLIAESSPEAGTRLVLRQARLVVADSGYPGVFLDVQAGRTLNDGGADPPRGGVEALLAHGPDYYMVLAPSSAGLIAWVSDGGQDRIERQVQLVSETFEYEDSMEPPAWRIEAAGELRGRIAVEDTGRAEDGEPSGSPGSYALVSGWIEEDGVRLDVFGLVRNPR